MDVFQELREGIALQMGLMFSGFSASVVVFEVEMSIFFGNLIMDTLFNVVSNSLQPSEVANSVISNYHTAIFILTLGGLVQGFLIGLLDQTSISIGYIGGLLFLVMVFGSALANVAPSVVLGMVAVFVAVLIGFFIRFLIKNKQQQNYRETYW